MIKKLFGLLAAALLVSPAFAQPQPGGGPSPWGQNGSTIYPLTSSAGVAMPSTVTGGNRGAGTINVQGLYVNGVAVPTTAGSVASISFASTGLTPATATTGAVTVAGVLIGANGGTGVANTGKTITIGGNFAMSGAYAFTGTLSGITTVTFPTNGTLATTTQLASYLPLAGGTMTGGILFSTTNTLDIGTSASVLAPRTVYAGTSFVGPVGTFTTSMSSPIATHSTSVAIAGCTISTNAICATGTSLFTGDISLTGSLKPTLYIQGSGTGNRIYPDFANNQIKFFVSSTGFVADISTADALKLYGLNGTLPIASFIGVTSAVNYAQLRSTTTTNYPLLEWNGTDSNVGAFYVTKGTGYHAFQTNGDGAGSTGTLQFRVTHTASATRALYATGSNGGNPGLDTSAGGVSISNAGTLAATITPTSLTAVGVILAPDGSSTAPGYSFSGASGTGFYRVAANRVTYATNAHLVVGFGDYVIGLNGNTTIGWGSGSDPFGSQNAGMGNPSNNVVSIDGATPNSGGGTVRVTNVLAPSATALGLGDSATTRWSINTSGHFMAAADNTYDIGASGATRPRTGYFGTSVSSPLYTAPSGNLTIQSASSSNVIINALASAAISLRTNSTERLIIDTSTVTSTLPFVGTSITSTGSASLTQIAETYTAPTISAGTLTINLANGTVFNVASNANISTFTISGATASKVSSFTLVLTGNGSGYTQAWGASVVWPSGTAPTLTTTNAKRDILAFVTNDGGTTWFGFVGGQNF